MIFVQLGFDVTGEVWVDRWVGFSRSYTIVKRSFQNCEEFTHFAIFVQQEQVCLKYRSHIIKWKEERCPIVEVVKTLLYYLFATMIFKVQ